MRGYAALLTGALAAMVSGLGLWSYTKADILEIIFLMAMIYMIAPGVFMITTEKDSRRKVKK
jgi:hypothetical protein